MVLERKPDGWTAAPRQIASSLQNEQSERDPVERFKEAQREFIGVAGRFDLDPKAKARAAELREEMKRASQEITKDPVLMRQAERSGITSQVKSLVRQAERERGREKGKGIDRDEGLER